MKGLYATLWILQGVDVLLTWKFIGMGLSEGNPLGRMAIETGWWAVVLIKIGITALFQVTWRLLAGHGAIWRRGELVALWVSIILLTSVAIWNLVNMYCFSSAAPLLHC